jgi:H+/Cl- antiporter ClcA
METTEKKNEAQEKNWLQHYAGHISYDMKNLFKWVLLATLTGVIVGAASSLFAFVLTWVTSYRKAHGWIFWLLPAAGVIIVFLYDKIGKEDRGTNQVFSTIRSQDEVLLKSAPLIFISTALTHLTGGSAGREGAAIQLGGSIGNQLGRWLHLDEEDRHVIVMCGMSAAFAAVFGTPMAASVFAMEVISVGIMYYAAFAPCVIAALIASGFAANLGIHPESFHVSGVPALTIETGIKMGIVAIGCAAVGILFCMALHGVGKFYGTYLKNKYLRVIVAGCVLIAATLLLRTTDYMGAGNELIAQAVEHGEAKWYAFLCKLILTAVTMKAGYRGGEIVPSFCIGATFGCVMGQLIGLSPSLCAAAGMAAVFCSVTNCPITSILIAFELFGFEGVSFYLIAVAISYATSGYYSLYKDQMIVYSKYKAKYVNHHTRI